ncbi:MAG: F0F1 ATP synthase subunit delta [Chlorobiaceae bacterium]|nr:F0F1 ATP synthase subunit delta [Chlorobiaceae bacterium]NTV59967.1 F0F1 ATP synthase subunit delta [Chlorobiaceae bacterium]
MSIVIASRRYATALMSAAEDGGFLDKAVEELKVIREVLSESRELVHALRSPLIRGDKKAHILEEIFSGSVSEKMLLFMNLISRKKRAGILPQIIDEFMIILDAKRGIVNADVTSAVTLSREQVDSLVSKLSLSTGKQIRATMSIDEELLGGVSVKIGDTIFDGSIKYQLQMLRQALVSERA